MPESGVSIPGNGNEPNHHHTKLKQTRMKLSRTFHSLNLLSLKPIDKGEYGECFHFSNGTDARYSTN